MFVSTKTLHLLRFLELIFDSCIVFLYFKSQTSFLVEEYKYDVEPQVLQARDRIYQLAIFTCFVMSSLVFLLSVCCKFNKKFPMHLIVYNTLVAGSFLAIGSVILRTWTKFDYHFFNEEELFRKQSGEAIGVLCAMQFILLMINSYLSLHECNYNIFTSDPIRSPMYFINIGVFHDPDVVFITVWVAFVTLSFIAGFGLEILFAAPPHN